MFAIGKAPSLFTVDMLRFALASVSVLAMLLANAAFAATRDEQTAACKGDAIRFCASEIPNEQKITSCMKANLDKLSPTCKAMFKQPASNNKRKKPVTPA
jgi:hypothetical protein